MHVHATMTEGEDHQAISHVLGADMGRGLVCRYPVILILLYNLGDFTGKMTPVIVPAATVSAPVPIFACAVARLAFVPAYFFAARAGVAPAMMVLTALLVRPRPRSRLLLWDRGIMPVC